MQVSTFLFPDKDCPTQRIRDQVEMNAQIAYRLQAEEQSKDQCQSFQTYRQASVSPSPSHTK